MNWALQRLVDEWLTHGKLIIACDFDDTLVPFKLMDPGSLMRMNRTKHLLLSCQALGARIVLFTCSNAQRKPEMLHWCEVAGIVVEAFNQNLPGLKYGSDAKPYANIYLDDRGGIEQTLDLLSAAHAIVSAHLSTKAQAD